MKITAQEEYGLRCLLQLARADKAKGLTVKAIASGEGLSPAYAEKLLRLLGKAGLIHSVQGVNGGYLLSKSPKSIRLGAVVRALGTVPSPKEICKRYPGKRQTCIHIDNCCIRAAWTTLTQTLEEFLDRTRLSDLLTSREAGTHKHLEKMAQAPFSV